MNHFVLLGFIVTFVCVEWYEEIHKLRTELQAKDAQLEAKKLEVMESDLYRQLNHRLQSLEAERDQYYAKLLEVTQLNSGLKIYKKQAQMEIDELQRNLEMDRQKLHNVEWELRYSKEEVDKLRVDNSEANRRINELRYKIENDPRNGCKCICTTFEAFGFCTHAIYRMATYAVRKFIGSNLILNALDFVFGLLEPQSYRLQIE